MKRLLTQVPVRLHLRSDLHVARKVWHATMGLFIVCLYVLTGMSRGTAVWILSSALGLIVLLEVIRLKMPQLNEKLVRFWGPIMRSEELNRVSGVPFYVAAVALSIAIFPKTIAVLSILYLAFGDPLASVFGILYGHKGFKIASGKSLIGTGAGVVVCFLVSLITLAGQGWSEGKLLTVSVLGGLAGGLAELLPLEVDDNFSIPIVSGFVLWLTFILLGV